MVPSRVQGQHRTIPATILTGARMLQQVVEELGMDMMEVKWAKSRLEHGTDEKVEGK
jgi:hypothetical protein